MPDTRPSLCAMRCMLLLAGLLCLPGRAAELVVAVARSALSLPVHVADAQGFFAAEGVAVRTVECNTGQRCLQQLFDRSAHLATASELPVVFSSFERSDYAIVATFVTSTQNIRLVGRHSAGVAAVPELAGKRVGVIAGSSAHYFLDVCLLYHGIDPGQVVVVALPSEQLVAALQRGRIDAFAGFSQHAGPALQALGADGVVLEHPRLYTETFNLVAAQSTLAAREDEVVKVLRGLERAQRFIREQPGQAREVLQARVGLEPAFASAIFQGFNFRLSLDQSLVSTMESEARWALREGHVAAGRKIPNYLDFVQAGPLRRAVPVALDGAPRSGPGPSGAPRGPGSLGTARQSPAR
jgi:ABC-type nitrate/sulfonate/bicarbonate transport system substrate-binding protein